MADMAAPHALSVPEILEHILLQLPALDLFAIQRVSRHWNELIMQSTKLQQQMFLQPIYTPLRPLKNAKEYKFESGGWYMKEYYSPGPTVFEASRLILHPKVMLRLLDDSEEQKPISSKVIAPEIQSTLLEPSSRIILLESPKETSGQNHRRLDIEGLWVPEKDCKQASWRKTFLTQPPITAVEFCSQDWREGGEQRYRMQNQAGVTLGDLEEWEELFRRMHGLKFGGRTLGHWAGCMFWVKRSEPDLGQLDSSSPNLAARI